MKKKNIKFFADIANYSGWLRTSIISRHLAIYELYKLTLKLPGSLVEFGVWRGSTFFFLQKLIEIFHSSSDGKNQMSNRKLYGFDTFTGFKEIHKNDQPDAKQMIKKVGKFNFDYKIFNNAFNHSLKDSKVSKRIHIKKGDIKKTWKKFLKENPGIRFCMVIVDMDLFKPTMIVLNDIKKYMVPGGIIVFDEYGYTEWPGETKAVDIFIKKHNLKLQSFAWSYGPGAYTII